MYQGNITKKIKKKTLDKEKSITLWKEFDKQYNCNNEEDIKLECLYRSRSSREYCEKCESGLAFSEEGFLVCVNQNCGIIYKDIIDQSAEWRYYGADDNQHTDPTRCGMPINPLLEESSFGCKVLAIGSMTYEMRKIKRYTDWQSMPYKEKSQYDEFQQITIMAQNAGLPKMIIDDAMVYHKKISEYEQTFRGDNRDGILAASIYISCRINNFPRTAKEIAIIFHLNITSATKGCKNALQIIEKIEADLDIKDKTDFGKTTSLSFIERYCSKLNINQELTKLCKFIASKIEKLNLMPENTPHSIAAGIVYFIALNCNLNITKKDVRNVSEISEVTINKCEKKLSSNKDQLLPAQICKKYNI